MLMGNLKFKFTLLQYYIRSEYNTKMENRKIFWCIHARNVFTCKCMYGYNKHTHIR